MLMENFCNFQYFLRGQGIAGFLNKGKKHFLPFFSPKYGRFAMLSGEFYLTIRVREKYGAVQMREMPSACKIFFSRYRWVFTCFTGL